MDHSGRRKPVHRLVVPLFPVPRDCFWQRTIFFVTVPLYEYMGVGPCLYEALVVNINPKDWISSVRCVHTAISKVYIIQCNCYPVCVWRGGGHGGMILKLPTPL